MDEASKSQIDRLGDRLRTGDIDEEDFRLLDYYRLSFREAFEFVVRRIRDDLGFEPTGRPAKSTTSIAEKLRRETIRLTQIQDIAGCRIVTPDILEQELVVIELEYQFKGAIVIDRRDNPSHGYRAVHVIVRHRGKLVEIQVRTALQHLWAELSEKLADLIDPAIKYGGGGENRPYVLDKTSEMVARTEKLEWELTQIPEEDRPQDADSHVEESKAWLFNFLRTQIEELTGK